MKIKRIISSIIAASMLSVCAPVMAEYIAPNVNNDIIKFEWSFDEAGSDKNQGTESVVGRDGTGLAKKLSADNVFYKMSDYNATLGNDFYLSMDFKIDDANFVISMEETAVGPSLSNSSGKIKLSHPSKELFTYELDKWYALEIEGLLGSDKLMMTIYEYTDAATGTKQPVEGAENIAMDKRNTTMEKTSASIKMRNMTIDNFKFIQEYTNSIAVTAEDAAISAGQQTALTAVTMRDDAETIRQYPVSTWTITDKTTGMEITDGSVKVENSMLVTTSHPTDRTVIVKATAEIIDASSDMPVTAEGETEITVTGLDYESEGVKTINISGADLITADGESTEQYSYEAFDAENNPVTDKQLVWSIYDSTNTYPYNAEKSKTVSISENGLLSIAKGAMAREIVIRASTESGLVYGEKRVTISNRQNLNYDEFINRIITETACETAMPEGASSVESFDGSRAYYGDSSSWTAAEFSQAGYTVTEMDIRFGADMAGFNLTNSKNNQMLNLRMRDGKLVKQTSSSGYSAISGTDSTGTSVMEYALSSDAWYHIEVLHSHEQKDVSLNLYAYDADGNRSEKPVFMAVSFGRRNDNTYGKLTVEKGTYVDNVRISSPSASEITLTSNDADNNIAAGASVQITANSKRNGLPLLNFSGLDWSVLDESGQPIIENADGTIDAEISTAGLLTTRAMGPLQTLTVQAKSGLEIETLEFSLYRDSIFEIIGVSYDGGAEEDGDDKVVNPNKIVQLTVKKNYEYSDDVTFLLAFYDENGVLVDVHTMSAFGSNYQVGTNYIPVDWDIAEENSNHTVKAFVWTRF